MTTSTQRIFSGMQPTGGLHVGNYCGALREWVELSRSGKYDCIFCVVDAHAITIDYDVKEMPARILETTILYLAAGIDPERCLVFLQSDVPQHMELAWYLGAVTANGDLARMTQFKEKSEQHKQNINAGLYTYPDVVVACAGANRGSVRIRPCRLGRMMPSAVWLYSGRSTWPSSWTT